MSNVGKTIKDFFCNGFFGSEYDLAGAIILLENDSQLVVITTNGVFRIAQFHEGWVAGKQKLIDEWVSNSGEY